MIHLIRTPESPYADEIEERLQELVLAHEVEVADAGDHDHDQLPLVRESGKQYRGRQQIDGFLAEISGEVMTGRALQSDSCVLDPDHPSRCL